MKNGFLARMEQLKKNLEAVRRSFPANEIVVSDDNNINDEDDHDSHHDQPDLAYNKAMWEDDEDEDEYDDGRLNKSDEIAVKPTKAKKEPKQKAEPKIKMVNKPMSILKEHEADRKFITGTITKKFSNLKAQFEQHLKDGSGDEALLAKVKKYKPELRLDAKKKLYVHLGDRSSAFTDILDETFNEHGPKFHPKIGVDNSKLENQAIATWSIPEKDFCPGAGDCISDCYVGHGPMGWTGPAISRWINAYSAKNDHFVPTMNKLLSQFHKGKEVIQKDFDNIKEVRHKVDRVTKEPKYKKGKPVMETIYHDKLDDKGNPIKHKWDHFRIHDSGDFHDDDYTEKWGNIIKDNPKIKFYAYSKTLNVAKKSKFKNTEKSYRMLNAMHENNAGNFNLRQSLGGVHDADIDPNKPHAVIFPDHEARKLAGYDDISAYDKGSSDREMVKGGLVFHSPSSKPFNFRKHLSRSPRLKELLSHVLEDYENRMKQNEGKKKPVKKRSKVVENEDGDEDLAASEVGSLIKSLLTKINAKAN